MTGENGITIVIPTLDRSDCLASCVQELLMQGHQALEILIVDQSETVDSRMAGMAKEKPGVISYHHVSFQSLPQARNYGGRNAKYEALLFLDDDIRCCPDLIQEHLRCLAQPGVGVVAGGVEEAGQPEKNRLTADGPGHFNPLTAVPVRNFSARGQRDVDHAPGGNFSTWRSIFESCGGVDEILNVGAALYEETDFCLRVKRAGYRVVFNGDARIVHLAVPRGGCRVPDVEKYVRGLAHNRAILIFRHVKWFARPVALGRLTITGCSFAIRGRNLRLLLACLAGAARGIRDARRDSRKATAVRMNAIASPNHAERDSATR